MSVLVLDLLGDARPEEHSRTRCLTMYTARTATPSLWANSGDIAVAQGDLNAGLRHLNEALAIRERLAASDPTNALWQRDLAASHFNLFQWAQQSGDEALAERELQNCFTVLDGMRQRGLHLDPPVRTFTRNSKPTSRRDRSTRVSPRQFPSHSARAPCSGARRVSPPRMEPLVCREPARHDSAHAPSDSDPAAQPVRN